MSCCLSYTSNPIVFTTQQLSLRQFVHPNEPPLPLVVFLSLLILPIQTVSRRAYVKGRLEMMMCPSGCVTSLCAMQDGRLGPSVPGEQNSGHVESEAGMDRYTDIEPASSAHIEAAAT